MNKILAILCCLFAASAFADQSALASSLSGAAAQSGALSTASQGNAQNITINGAPYPTNQTIQHTGTSTVKTVPMVYAPPMGVTAPCRVALSAGVSVIGVGVAAGGSVADAPCNLRELARTYQALGKPDKGILVADGALALECADEAVAKALGDLCPPKAGVLPARRAEAETPVKVAEQTCRSEMSPSGIRTTICK